ncbi:MAG: DUF1430 domain-containing protein [Enterococcus sp.]
MKKKIYIGFLVQLAILIAIFFSCIGQVSLATLLYKDTTKISILMPETPKIVDPELQENFLEETAQKYNVNLAKYIYSDDEHLTIYSTSKNMNDQLHVIHDKETITSNKDFIWDGSNIQIKINNFSNITETGIDGVYYVHNLEDQNVDRFVSELASGLGEIKQENSKTYYLRVIAENILGNYTLVVVFLLFFLVNLSLFFMYLLKSTKKITILKLAGFSNWSTIKHLLKEPFVFSIVSSSIALMSVIASYSLFRGGFYNAKNFTLVVIANLLICLLFWSLMTSTIVASSKKWKINNRIKGQNRQVLGLIFNQLLKVSIVIAILMMAIVGISKYKELQAYETKQHYWEKTENIYATQLRFITNNPEEYRPYEKKLKKFYLDAVENKGLFLIDTKNFEKLETINQYVYEANTKNKLEQFISPRGRSIDINLNYLKYNPVYKPNGDKVTEADIVFDENVWNVLVPEGLKKYEEQLKSNFLDYFSFKKYLFNDKMKGSKNGLKIHIVYVKDKQTYFSYNPAIDSDNLKISLATAIVDTGNVDESEYGSWLSNSTFVKAKDEDGYSYLLPTIKRNHVQSNIQNTIAIYNFQAQEIQNLKYLLNTLYLLSGLLVILLGFTYYNSIKLYDEKNKKRIAIQELFGYTTILIYKNYFIFQLILGIVLIAVVGAFYHSALAVELVASFTVLELAITYLICSLSKRKLQINSIIKGE